MNWKKRGLIAGLLLCFISIGSVDAQNTQQGMAQAALTHYGEVGSSVDSRVKLSAALDQLEKMYNISFMYKSDLLVYKTVSADKLNYDNLTLALQTLLEPFNLTYTRLNNRTFAISFDFSKYTTGEQQKVDEQVQGTVTDAATGETLPGVNVMVKGTTRGAATNVDGEYQLMVESLQDTLLFSFIGYQTNEVPIEGRTTIDVELAPQAIAGDELVVIGYGSRKETSMTGSVSTMEVEQVNNEPSGNIVKSLQGNIPGVSVVRSKDPGSGATVRIHGLGTIGDNSPLWIVDGVQTDAHNLSPSDIESITVLKDAASTAVYGARGANGVILVETKEGIKGDGPNISFSSRFGMSKQYKKHDMLGVYELGEVRYLSQVNSGIEDPTDPMYRYGPNGEVDVYNYLMPSRTDEVDESLYDRRFAWEDGDGLYQITRSNPAGTDWYGAVTNIGRLQDHTLTVTGGSEKSTYGITAGFNEESATIGTSKFSRLNLRAKSTHDVTDWLRFGENIRLIRSDDIGYQNQGTNGILEQVIRIPTIVPLTDIDGYHSPFTKIPGAQGNHNPVASIAHGEDIQNVNIDVEGSASMEINPVENLQLKSIYGFSLGNSHYKSPLEKTPEELNPRSHNELTESYGRSTYWSLTNTLTHIGTIGENHSYEILLGSELMESTSNILGASRSKFHLTNEDYWVMDAGEENMENYGSLSDWGSVSIFTRLHYELLSKYLVDFTLRRDGSSRFGRNHRYGTFPAASMAWRLSEENFMAATENWLNDLKIRVSWGQSGNDRIGNYNGFSTYVADQTFSYYPIQGQNSGLNAGFQSEAFGNPNAKWEITTSRNIGLDASLFDRLNLTFDVWQKNTTDMLYPKRIPFVNGIAEVPNVNIGEMKNYGIDVGLKYSGMISNDLTYSLSTNISHFKNEIVQLADTEGEMLVGDSFTEQSYTRAEKGTSFPEFYGYVVEGIFQTEEEANNHPEAFGNSYNKPGHFKYKDINSDGVIDSNDRTYIGSPHPDFTASLTGYFAYKNFDFSFQLYGTYGNEIMNIERRQMDFNFYQLNRGTRRLYESWGSPYLDDNKNAKMPIAEVDDSDSQRPSSYYVEDGSFLRLQQVQFGYVLPQNITGGLLRRLRMYVTATDLFTITKFSGLDPEIPWDGMSGGINHGTWPTARRFMFGVTLDL